MKATLDEPNLKDKISEDANKTAEKEEFEHHQKELEAVCNPIITKLYQSASGAAVGMPGGFPGSMAGEGVAAPGVGSGSGPTIE
uniref:Uncharacterized protein n=1 Tax=Megaselia scalaris TaxID=36166 RepID=T1GQE6_MEGSC